MRKVLAYARRHHIGLLALFVALGGTSYAAVKLPKNSVGTKQLKPNAVISSRVRNGSLLRSDFKAGQLPRGATGARGATGSQGPKGDPTYKRTVLVSPVGTDAENGNALRSALAGITDASFGKRYLIKIEPGSYDIGSTPLAMKPWVDLEGSGEFTTLINGSVEGDDKGTIVSMVGVSLRDLNVGNSVPAGGATFVNAIYASTGVGQGIFLDHVDAAASKGFFVRGLVVDGANTRVQVSSSLLIGVFPYPGGPDNPAGASGLLLRNGAIATLDDADLEVANVTNGYAYGAYVIGPDSILNALWSRFTGFSGVNSDAKSVEITFDGSAFLKASELNGPTEIFPSGTLICAQSFTSHGGELSAACS